MSAKQRTGDDDLSEGTAQFHIDVLHLRVLLARLAQIGYPGDVARELEIGLRREQAILERFESRVVDQEIQVGKVTRRLGDVLGIAMLDVEVEERQAFVEANVPDLELAREFQRRIGYLLVIQPPTLAAGNAGHTGVSLPGLDVELLNLR